MGVQVPGVQVRGVLIWGVLIGGPAAHATDAPFDWHAPPAQIAATCADALAATRAQLAARPAQPPFAVVLATENAVAALDEALVAQRLLADISADDAVRAAASDCAGAVAALRIELAGDPVLYAAAAAAARDAPDAIDRALAAHYAEAGRRSGAALPPQRRARLRTLLERLQKLESGYIAALGADRRTVVFSAAEIAALPESARASLARAGDGYAVPVDNHRYELVMRHAPAAARERYWRAYFAIGGRANVRRLEAALALRRDIARLAGCRDWATCQLATRMAATPERALALVDDVDATLLPRAREEIAHLASIKRADGDLGAFAQWDYAYYQTRDERARFAIDSEALRRYFPVERVVPAVLREYERLFSLRFVNIEPARAWADGVERYAIVDGDATIGEFYLDLAPRAGKFLRPANFALRSGRLRPDGTYTRPVSSIIGNGPAAAPGEPALFSHRELADFFHEFGHVMHTTLSTARYATLYGANTRMDFTEAPSQIFENWAWHPDVLARVSGRVGDGAPLPADLAARLVAARYASAGATWTRQAMFAAYDLSLHGPDAGGDTTRRWRQFAKKYTALAPVRGVTPQASFLPLMGGYDAAYYGYLWSLVYAQDLYTAFAPRIDDPAVGARYRRAVLEPGGTENPEVLVERFLGRKPNAEAFYRDLGIAR
ncbi:M3 family metallopeptidase [Tahibacter soli]|uniref:Zn-dependent oligopeptidase n=1 Tax=Tahibacter soli TaxID=2983605 RepID=A0A9X3YLS2_9GAMM|nr:M3 family metallopeptidase [Tahibacter soli]MDC8014602.1 Zn-dependent oligopeptidase [Tahibacter soli]